MTPATPLLLDTHFWIWSLQGETNRISPSVTATLNTAAEEGRLLVHPMSVWEVGLLVKKRRITLDRPVRQWIDEALHLPGVRVAEFSPEIAMEAALLDAPELKDPVDRILVAAAQALGATLVTLDRKILDWAAGGGVRVMGEVV